jgi:uncharacterized integral membrane protein (TIGR00697 family)
MPNEIYWVLFLAVDLSLMLLAFRLWGKYGIYAFIGGSIIVCNIQVLVTVELFGMVATLGNIIYASIFLGTDILNEIYGEKEARRGVWIGFFMLLWANIAMQAALFFEPIGDAGIFVALQQIFELFPRVTIASLLAYLVSQHHDIWSFARWKRATADKHLWLRNNASTIVSQFIDSLVFTAVAFLGAMPFAFVLEIFITTFVLKLLVAAADTPFVYLARRLRAPVD